MEIQLDYILFETVGLSGYKHSLLRTTFSSLSTSQVNSYVPFIYACYILFIQAIFLIAKVDLHKK